MWKDAADLNVRVGHILIDDRGKAWRVLETEPSIRAQGIARVVEVRARRGRLRTTNERAFLLRLYSSFIVPEEDVPLSRTGIKVLYWTMQSTQRDSQRAKIQARHKTARRAVDHLRRD